MSKRRKLFCCRYAPQDTANRAGEDKCPECGRVLIVMTAPTGASNPGSKGLNLPIIGGAVAALAALGIAAFIFLGNPSPSPSAMVSAQASPPSTAAQQIVRSPTPTPTKTEPAKNQDLSVVPTPANNRIINQVAAKTDEPKIVLTVAGSNTIGAKLGPAWVVGMLTQKGYVDVETEQQKDEEWLISGHKPNAADRIGVAVRAHGSSTGFKDLIDTKTDLAMSSRPVEDKEVDQLKAIGDMRSAANEHVVALDGLAIIMHRSNPLTKLSVGQVADLFSGKISNWSQIGGADLPVHVFARDNNSGTWDTFKSLVLAPRKLDLVKEAVRLEDSTELSNNVSGDAGAVGFIGLPYIGQTKAAAIFDGDALPLYPNSFTVATEDYPLARRLFLYTPSMSKNPYVIDLVSFALSKEGQEVATNLGFVGLNIDAVKAPVGAEAPADYVKYTQGSTRLSLNFRFRPGSTQLDNKALRDLDRLIDFIARNGGNRKSQVYLFGFTDNVGQADSNVALSKQRANVVGQELSSRGITPAQVIGFGPTLAVAANATPEGRERNRRVEVWIKQQ